MHTIVLAAGGSKRFVEEGYLIPKPFLKIDWRGRTLTMLEHVMNTIPLAFEDGTTIAVPPGWEDTGEHALENIYGDVVRIEGTKGPAHTLLKVLENREKEAHIIMDVDVLNDPNDLYSLPTSAILRDECCCVLVSESANPAHSYVESKKGEKEIFFWQFNRIVEKERISKYAVRGAYYVTKEAYSKFMRQLEKTVQDEPEPFISHVLNQLKIPKVAEETSYTPIDWGTPRDVKLSGAHIVYEKEE